MLEYLIYIAVGLLVAVLALALYVRLAPLRAEAWHADTPPVLKPGTYPGAGSHVVERRIDGDGHATLERLDRIIRATPRTQAVAGALAAGKITYVTRSAVMGFPDYTTVTLARAPDEATAALQIYGRLRFGRSDLGVNRKRIEGWLAQLDAAG
ncbi:DUF1499 domain-containing protein [Thalassorhabdomicrobium marinisediminis]|uniref:DUF1499 domain-containing protein n=1 Tax=Thalassorhabdomicrobium marinisediminis TaxID=2170577 RepID=UPI0024939B3E|nr:DUF1499 domain-containing protein [Thalassorhabdomicrobium marinisediminis]